MPTGQSVFSGYSVRDRTPPIQYFEKQNSHTLPRTSGQLHFSMSHFKCQFLLKKNRKKLKKVVDKPLKGWYYSQRCSERQH